jgi:hypothetical protein
VFRWGKEKQQPTAKQETGKLDVNESDNQGLLLQEDNLFIASGNSVVQTSISA